MTKLTLTAVETLRDWYRRQVDLQKWPVSKLKREAFEKAWEDYSAKHSKDSPFLPEEATDKAFLFSSIFVCSFGNWEE